MKRGSDGWQGGCQMYNYTYFADSLLLFLIHKLISIY
jgi:hypothetical protein